MVSLLLRAAADLYARRRCVDDDDPSLPSRPFARFLMLVGTHTLEVDLVTFLPRKRMLRNCPQKDLGARNVAIRTEMTISRFLGAQGTYEEAIHRGGDGLTRDEETSLRTKGWSLLSSLLPETHERNWSCGNAWSTAFSTATRCVNERPCGTGPMMRMHCAQ